MKDEGLDSAGDQHREGAVLMPGVKLETGIWKFEIGSLTP